MAVIRNISGKELAFFISGYEKWIVLQPLHDSHQVTDKELPQLQDYIDKGKIRVVALHKDLEKAERKRRRKSKKQPRMRGIAKRDSSKKAKEEVSLV